MIGRRIGPYRIDHELGSGGMGTVYAATTMRKVAGLEGGTTLALKVVHPHLLASEGFFKRFLREADIGKRIVHENVVRTLDCDQLVVDGTTYTFLTMEYVEGQTLRGLAREIECVPEDLCRHIGREVSRGLAAIHAAGVVHRDVKPENVLITADHVVKVMDLGVARLNDEVLRLSQTGGFVGSIHYAAPECFSRDGESIDGRADLHALGLVLYELSCGVNPYVADGIPGVLKRVLHEDPRRLGDVNPQLSPFFEEVVHCLLAKDPAERFTGATALLDVLEAGESSAWWRERARALQTATKRPIRRIRIPRETGVHGRERPIATLRTLFERATGGEGQVVLIEGEAGIGKSRLVDELIGRLQRAGEDLNFLFGSYPPNGAATASGAFSAAYFGQFGEAGSAPWLRQSPTLVPAFDALLSGDLPPEGSGPLTKESLQTCFVHATRNLAAERTTVILIDDLHFAPEEGRALFTALAMAVPGHRVLLIGTTRPGADETWRVHLDRMGAVRIPLERLGLEDLVALLGEFMKSEHLAQEIAATVAAKSDGNPFFVFEILRGLREGQFITQSPDGTWVTTGAIRDIEIPGSVLDLVNARVAALTAEERDLLDVAACCGYEFDPLLVGEVMGMGRIPLLKRLSYIERRHRLVRSAGLAYVFDHHQVQEALYGSLSEPLRREYHTAVAEGLDARAQAMDRDPTQLDGALCVDLCEHFLKGGRGEQALRYLPAAQAHLQRQYVNARAVDLAERALAAPGLLEGAERAEALLRLGGILDRLGRRERQEEAAREALRLAQALGDDDLRGRAAGALGVLLLRTWRLDEAEEHLQCALDCACVHGDADAEIRAAGHLGALAYFQGRHDLARERHERARRLSRAREDVDGEATACGNLGILLLDQGRLTEASQLFERQLVLSRELADPDGEATATGSLGGVCYLQGRLEEARAYYEQSLALSRQVGDRESEAIAIGNVANMLGAEGRLADARDGYLRSLALAREIGSRQLEVGVLTNLAPYWPALGEVERAHEDLAHALELAQELGLKHAEGHLLECLGTLADEAGDQEEAERLFQASLDLRREIRSADGVVDVLIELADLRRRQGDSTGARAALDEALPMAREQGRRGPVAITLAMGACLPGGDPEAARAAVESCPTPHHARRGRWLLWTATGDPSHLLAAQGLLDEAASKVPPAYRTALRTASRVNRGIVAESQKLGLGG